MLGIVASKAEIMSATVEFSRNRVESALIPSSSAKRLVIISESSESMPISSKRVSLWSSETGTLLCSDMISSAFAAMGIRGG